MTREEAKTILKNAAWLGTHEDRDKVEQAVGMAIQALENHDTFMKYAYSQGKHDALSQEQKSGKWIIKDRYYHDTITAECSECHREVEIPTCMEELMYDFCPICGAKMESEEV